MAFSNKWDTVPDMPNLEGKVALVTGGKYVVLTCSPRYCHTLFSSLAFAILLYLKPGRRDTDWQLGVIISKGLGYHTVASLASHGARVYMGSRSMSKGQEAVAQIYATHPRMPTNQIIPLALDLESPECILAAVAQLGEMETKLHILGKRASSLVQFQSCADSSSKAIYAGE